MKGVKAVNGTGIRRHAQLEKNQRRATQPTIQNTPGHYASWRFVDTEMMGSGDVLNRLAMGQADICIPFCSECLPAVDQAWDILVKLLAKLLP